MRTRVAVSTALAALALVAGCSECGGRREVPPQGAALPWEALRLGADEASLSKDIAALLGASGPVSCGAQLSLVVPDLENERLDERSAGTHTLAFCSAAAGGGAQPSGLIDVRGELVDGRTVRLAFRFQAARRDGLAASLAARFGPGEKVELDEESLGGGKDRPCDAWKRGAELWLVGAGVGGSVVVVHQDLASSRALPAPQQSERGKPVSLEDIGIGRLDLKAAPPDIALPDAGRGAATAP